MPRLRIPDSATGRRAKRWLPVVGGELVALTLLVLAFVAPKLTASSYLMAFIPMVMITLLATMHVWLLLRVDLLSFAAPPFMAVGGYTVALIATNATSNAVLLTVASLLVPAVAALLLGALLLRLRGTYFALVTFVLAQIVVLAILLSRNTLGGNSGISGVPPASLGSLEFAAEGDLVRFSAGLAILGLVITSAAMLRWRRHFAAIKENEELASSLGLNPWGYKTVAFVISGGLAGLAGLVLVNRIGNAHPDSFNPFLSVEYVAAAVIGGTLSIIGVLIGALALTWLTETFSSQAEYAQLLLGGVLVLVVLYARQGLTGATAWVSQQVWRTVRHRTAGPQPQKRSGAEPCTEDTGHHTPPGAVVTDQRHQLLELRGLAKSFGGVVAVHDIDLDLHEGEIFGVIGPNGAGKTTLINMLAGELTPTSGEVRLDGSKVHGSASYRMARRGVARSYQQTSVFSTVSVRENLERARRFSSRWMPTEELEPVLHRLGLAERIDDRAGDLPYGLQKVLGLVLAVATVPRVLLLDEPAAGLELSERRRVDEIVRLAVARGCAVLLVEHDMDLVRRICERVLVMDLGGALAEGAPDVVLADRKVVAAYLGEAGEQAQAEESDVVVAVPPTGRSGTAPSNQETA